MNCAECGGNATNINSQGIPVCARHTKSKIKSPKCPSCGLEMRIRESKYGKFWGCMAFPMCDGLKKL